MQEQARRNARADLAAFTKAVRFEPPARHHRHLIDRLHALERGDIRRLMVLMPPGSAKSTYTSILFPPWAMGRNPRWSVIAGSHTATLAERFGRRVRNLVASDEYADIFSARLAPDSKAAFRWSMQEGGEYLAAGAGAAIVGFRADLGILDDPVAGREQADSELEREKLWQWYLNDYWTRLKPGARVVLIMQRWHEDDLAGRLLKEMARGGEQWEVVKLKMEADEHDPLGRAPGEPLWPEWFTPEMLAQAKRDARSWSALYQQEPRPDVGGEFRRAWLRHYKAKPTRGLNTYILVDPAGEKKKGSDRTGMWLIGAAEDQNIYVLDAVRKRMSLTERADQIFAWHRSMRQAGMPPQVVLYEKYGMQADIEHLLDRMEREQYRFRVEAVGGSLKKEDRIRRLVPWFEQGRIWLPESLHKTDEQGDMRDVIADFIEEEYAPFPVSKWFDAIDALSRLEDLNAMGLLTWPSDKVVDISTMMPRISSWDSV